MKLTRYFTYSTFEKVLFETLGRHPEIQINNRVLGKSVLGRSIYALQLGSGEQRILIWSQMHGNESSTTRALLDVLNSGELVQFLSKVKLYIIPVLNPDGAQDWTRVNARQVDLNRDAVDQTQIETQVLMKAYNEFDPHYCLNLHGQRTIYGDESGTQAAQVSFLAPAGDPNRNVTSVRLKAMQLINAMVGGLGVKEPAFIGRYSDAFNLNCVGDYFTNKGTPTVLFEAGHAGTDYNRDEVVSVMSRALKICISQVIAQRDSGNNQVLNKGVLETYLNIPPLYKTYCDILIKNMLSESGNRVDLSVMYQEEIKDGVLYFIPCIVGVNDPDVKAGHRVLDLLHVSQKSYDFEILASGVILSTTFEIVIFCE